MSDEEKVTCEK